MRFYQTKLLDSKASAKTYCEALINSSKPEQKTFAYTSLGYLFSKEANYKGADSLFRLANIELEKINNLKVRQTEKMYVLDGKSVRYLDSQNIESAFALIEEGKQLAQKLQHTKMTIRFNLKNSSTLCVGVKRKV